MYEIHILIEKKKINIPDLDEGLKDSDMDDGKYDDDFPTEDKPVYIF